MNTAIRDTLLSLATLALVCALFWGGVVAFAARLEQTHRASAESQSALAVYNGMFPPAGSARSPYAN